MSSPHFKKLAKLKSRIETLLDQEDIDNEDAFCILMYIICENNKFDTSELEGTMINCIKNFNCLKGVEDGST